MRLLIMALLALSPLSLFAKEAIELSCKGYEEETQKPVSFDFVLSEFDGQDYQYQALENVVDAGTRLSNIDLRVTQVKCFDGRTGSQFWTYDPQSQKFYFHSGCENEATEYYAVCKRRRP